VALIPCKECDQQISDDAKTCPHCGKKIRSGAGRGCLVAILALGVIFVLFITIPFMSHNSENTTVRPGPTVSAVPPVRRKAKLVASNDAEQLIARCGQPSSDDSTANDNPRPPIPSRIIEYEDQKLRFLFMPGGSSKVGDAPPYKWKLVGTTDMTAADPSQAQVVSPSEVARRMPCWAGR
jgi:hypothetical protein